MQKQFISPEQLLQVSFQLAVKIYESGFRPNFIVGLWRGGSPVGIVVQDCLAYLEIKTDHISLRTSYRGMESYGDMVDNRDRIRVHGTRYLFDRLNAEDALLIVDDVYSTGYNIEAVIERLRRKTRRNMPADVRIAVPWYKPTHNRTGRVPDFYLHETADWLVLPHELNGLTAEEIASHKPEVARLAQAALGKRPE
ncbi:hypoxanthine phosphoribosyltransferase [Exilibacterium tricleocarpae]|uniref:Hypoxanthine phosphoribosyltransferase n=1 Tax=Exilibacterium tricleocarpae TaxID=2591008 RepID=A0A545U9V2_9GAMM|nr:phosphoribosyltransferase family protein [Exilibacterium tricleocarpae]TQV86209.1 hypoxanthine phosphoribosyltransferase [Exilibacterium tricleocarpae]